MMLGDVLYPKSYNRPAFVPVPTTDVRTAAAKTLAEYVRRVVFLRHGGESRDVTSFKIARVYHGWPDTRSELAYPSVSIVDTSAVSLLAHHLQSSPLESTQDVYGTNTMLWKLGDISHVFQLDFWLDNEADREAVASAIPGMFDLGGDRSNVVLQGPTEYFCLPVRCALESFERIDTSATVYARERRLTVRVRCDSDVVELRCTTEFEPQITYSVSETVTLTGG